MGSVGTVISGGPSGPGAQSENGPSPQKGDPVNIYTGNEYQEVSDLEVWGGVGTQGLKLTRWSNSRAVGGSAVFGQGHYFRHNYQ